MIHNFDTQPPYRRESHECTYSTSYTDNVNACLRGCTVCAYACVCGKKMMARKKCTSDKLRLSTATSYSYSMHSIRFNLYYMFIDKMIRHNKKSKNREIIFSFYLNLIAIIFPSPSLFPLSLFLFVNHVYVSFQHNILFSILFAKEIEYE